MVLGGKGNSESLIRTQAGGGEDSVIVSALKDDVLNCKESREFWIGWMNHAGGMGTLQVNCSNVANYFKEGGVAV